MPGSGRRQFAGGVMMVEAVVSVSTTGQRRIFGTDERMSVDRAISVAERLARSEMSLSAFACSFQAMRLWALD